MEHSFDVDIAIKHGVEKAVILKNLTFWVLKNFANKKHIHKGMCWTYNSQSAFAELFPYMSQQKIGRHLRDMESNGLIKSGNFNKAGYDRTKWYTVPSLFIIQNQTMDRSELNVALLGSEQPIPDSKPDKKTDNINSFNFEDIKASWNEASIESDCVSKKTIVFPEKAKKDLPKIYKKYEAIKKSLGKEPESKNNFCRSYFKAVLDWAEPWAGKGNMESFKVSLEYSVRMDTFDKVMNWVAGE